MNTMTTYSGRKFDPMQMTPGDVYIEDIAHALSLLCRGGGQLTYFYSVGQHSLNCAAEAKARGWSKRQQLACLLHDASEGYISDIIRPVKIYLTNYLEIESKIMGTILTHFGPVSYTHLAAIIAPCNSFNFIVVSSLEQKLQMFSVFYYTLTDEN